MQNPRKFNKTQILTIVILAAIFILLCPVPMSRSKEEPYITTETVDVPYQVVKTAQWNATWFLITVNRQWGPSIGTQTFEPTFIYDWGYGSVYAGYNDGIGFTADTSFYVQTPGMYTFTIGGDDGTRLYVDGILVITNWRDQPYSQRSTIRYFSIGWHTMSIGYYEYLNAAKVLFDVDKGNLFTWEETQYLPLVIHNHANRTVTETVYVSILEYLMKGAKP